MYIQKLNTSLGGRNDRGARKRSSNPIRGLVICECFFLLGLFALGALLCRSQGSWAAVIIIVVLGQLLTGIWHIRIENARTAARRGIRFYQSGLERLDGI